MKITLIGPRNDLGVGVHFSNFVDTIQRMHGIGALVQEVDIGDHAAMVRAAETSAPDDINICFTNTDLQGHFRGTNIQWIVFESTRVPEIVMRNMLTADLVWVPSNWGRQTLIDNGLSPDRVDVVPEGVDTARFHPYQRRNTNSVMRFLSVGKYEQRKSQHELLAAWHQVFAGRTDVELFIKTHSFFDPENKRQELLDILKALDLQNVSVYWGALTGNELADLYQSADVFVLASKGEAWGLPLLEAAASGLPIIATCYSGHDHYLKHIPLSVLPVQYDMAPITCPDFQYCYPTADGNFGTWAAPRPASIASCLVTAKHNISVLRSAALDNALAVRSQFGWTQSVERALQVLQQRGLLVSNH